MIHRFLIQCYHLQHVSTLICAFRLYNDMLLGLEHLEEPQLSHGLYAHEHSRACCCQHAVDCFLCFTAEDVYHTSLLCILTPVRFVHDECRFHGTSCNMSVQFQESMYVLADHLHMMNDTTCVGTCTLQLVLSL